MKFHHDRNLHRYARLMEEPIPAHVVHCRSLTLDLGETEKIEETKNRIVSLIKKSDPVSLTLNLIERCGHIFTYSAISEMENFARLELDLDFYALPVLFHVEESYAMKLEVLHVSGGQLANFDRLTSLVELKLDQVKVSEKELQKIASLPQLKILRLPNGDVYWDDFGKYLFTSGLVQLVELDLSDNNFDYSNVDLLKYLKPLMQLRKLNLRNTSIIDAQLGDISNLRELSELNISQNHIKLTLG